MDVVGWPMKFTSELLLLGPGDWMAVVSHNHAAEQAQN